MLHVQSCCFANLNLLLLWRSRCHRRRCLGPVHTYQDIFESATFSLRIRLPSTRIWCIRHTNPQVFESALQSGNFLIRHESSRRCRAECYRCFTSWTSVSSLITCMLLNLAMITVHFNYAKRRLDILELLSLCHPQTDKLDVVNMLRERKSAWWENFVSEEDWP